VYEYSCTAFSLAVSSLRVFASDFNRRQLQANSNLRHWLFKIWLAMPKRKLPLFRFLGLRAPVAVARALACYRGFPL